MYKMYGFYISDFDENLFILTKFTHTFNGGHSNEKN